VKRDPRASRRYRTLRTTWLRAADPTCALCGKGVDISLPGTHPWGPTIEHTIPVRTILAVTDTWPDALAMACDTTLWAMAHTRCQQQQGARATSAINAERHRRDARRRGSRDW
jgi:hypothetical protein